MLKQFWFAAHGAFVRQVKRVPGRKAGTSRGELPLMFSPPGPDLDVLADGQ
jgi:hypothetical protein